MSQFDELRIVDIRYDRERYRIEHVVEHFTPQEEGLYNHIGRIPNRLVVFSNINFNTPSHEMQPPYLNTVEQFKSELIPIIEECLTDLEVQKHLQEQCLKLFRYNGGHITVLREDGQWYRFNLTRQEKLS